MNQNHISFVVFLLFLMVLEEKTTCFTLLPCVNDLTFGNCDILAA